MTIQTPFPDRRTAWACTLLAGSSVLFSGCLMKQNDTVEVAGQVPLALQEKPMGLGREPDARSVVAFERENWAASDYAVASDLVAHRPTYARRNTRLQVSARASGQYPTLAEAITLPGGPSENEQIYDAVAWPILIMPAAFLVPVGLLFEPWFTTTVRSPGWEYDRHPPAAREGWVATGDPLVDRLGMPVIVEEAGENGRATDPAYSPLGSQGTPATAPTDPPAAVPVPEPLPAPAGGPS